MKSDICQREGGKKPAAEQVTEIPKLKQGNFLALALFSIELLFNADADDSDVVMLDRAACKLLDLFQYLMK